MTTNSVNNLDVVVDGREYVFSDFASAQPIAGICIAAFHHYQSKSVNAETRKRTNATLYHNYTALLKFARDTRSLHIDQQTCFSYKTYLGGLGNAQITQINKYGALANIASFAIAKGLIADFQVPRRGSLRAAILVANGGGTLADRLDMQDVEQSDWQTHAELNRRLLKELHEYCWERIIEVRDRQRQGVVWRDEVLSTKAIRPAQANRLELIRVAIQGQYLLGTGLSNVAVEDFRLGEFLKRDYVRSYGITKRELSDYLVPSMHQIYPFVPLFAILRMNSAMIAELRTDILVDSPLEKNKKIIEVVKGRANRELTFGHYAVGGAEARTIPRAWAILTEVVDRIRAMALPHHRSTMFLNVSVANGCEPRVAPIDMKWALEHLTRDLASLERSRYAPLPRLRGRLWLKDIRNTVQNVDRYQTNIETTSRRAQHRDKETTSIYLNNPSMRAMLDEEMVEGQDALVQSVYSKALVIAPDARRDEVAQRYGLSIKQATSLLNDELNLGYGVSLISEFAFVIDNPHNYLRMTKWLEKMEGARDRIEGNNPDRWRSHFEPQIALFKQAIEDFPRKTRMEAQKIAHSTTIDFPEPE